MTMTASRLVLAALAVAGTASAAESPVDQTVAQAAARAEQKAAQAPQPLALEFRLRAALALRERYPELSRKFLDTTLAELRGGKDWVLGSDVLQALVELSPAEAVAILPYLHAGSAQMMIGPLARANHRDEALALFRETAARFAEPLEPADATWLVLNALPEAAAECYERVIRAASAPDYGIDAKSQMTATFQIGQSAIATGNTRDTLLLLAGTRLRALAPDRFEKFIDTFARWKIDGPAVVKNMRSPAPGAPAAAPEAAAISKRMGAMRGLPTDADRARLATDLVRDIRALPAAPQRLSLIRSLSNVATEGDLGKEALGAVAATLAAALREQAAGASGNDYIGLAKLVRYEHLDVPLAASLEAALALLELRERIQQENGFALTGMDGKTYSLAGLKGRIVLLNFWATWCPPCRKEMPDMEKLYRAYEKKGLTVLAVSDEDRATVEQFLAKNAYSFPVALDAGGKVNAAFSVDGIPKSFIFDRQGRLAAQAIDMRTESQFLELLKMAGLE
jgi:peroxiredoxin